MQAILQDEAPLLRRDTPVRVTNPLSLQFGQTGSVVASGHRGFCYSVRFPSGALVWIERDHLEPVAS